jgi:hypothetical protein
MVQKAAYIEYGIPPNPLQAGPKVHTWPLVCIGSPGGWSEVSDRHGSYVLCPGVTAGSDHRPVRSDVGKWPVCKYAENQPLPAGHFLLYCLIRGRWPLTAATLSPKDLREPWPWGRARKAFEHHGTWYSILLVSTEVSASIYRPKEKTKERSRSHVCLLWVWRDS